MLGNKSKEIFSVEPTISGIKSSLKKKQHTQMIGQRRERQVLVRSESVSQPERKPLIKTFQHTKYTESLSISEIARCHKCIKLFGQLIVGTATLWCFQTEISLVISKTF